MENKTKKVVSKAPFVKHILDRIKNNKNCVIAVVGETGSGKSYSALRLAEVLDPNFSADNIAFKASEFLDLLRKDMPKGSAIIFDECGVGWQSREFMSIVNRALSYAMQTVRFKNHIILMTVPDMSFVDAQGRKLIHMTLITERILREKKCVRLRPYILSITRRTGKEYMLTPRISRGGKILKIHKIDVSMPDLDLINLYEKKKLKYVDELYESAYAKISKKKNSNLNSMPNNRRTVFELHRAGVSASQTAKVLGLSRQSVYNMRNENKEAGFNTMAMLPTKD